MIENQPVRLFESAVRAASTASPDNVVNRFYRGVDVIIDMTVVPGVDTVTFFIEGQDPVSGKWYLILASAALVAVATTVLRVYPGLTPAANAVASAALPRAWRVRTVHSAGTNFTYSVGAQLIR